jgi:hypothetical protein
MIQPDRYSFIPPLEKRHIPLVVLWIVVVIIAALIGSQAASASPIVFGSPLQSPLPTPTPQPLVVSFAPAAGARDVQRHTPLSVTLRLDVDHRIIERGLTTDRRSAARSSGRAAPDLHP